MLDGCLYLYKISENDTMSNEDAIGMVNVQIKGREVENFIEENFQYRIDISDLQFYLLHPVIYIVCQEKKGTKEKQLYYKAIAPEDAKRIIRSHKEQKSALVLLQKMPEKREDFEQIVVLFHKNCQLQSSFAQQNPFTIADATRAGFKNFTFVAPSNLETEMQLMKYLSEHPVYLYAKGKNEFDAAIPINDAFGKMIFSRQHNDSVCIDGKEYYKEYTTKIKNGRRLICIGRCITLDTPIDEQDGPARFYYKNHERLLDESIEEAEVLLALYTKKKITISNTTIDLYLPQNDYIKEIQERLPQWIKIQALFKLMHIEKPLDLSLLTVDDEQKLSILISLVYDKQTCQIPDEAVIPYIWNIQGVNILLRCSKDDDGNVSVTDFFNPDVVNNIYFKESEPLQISPYSYLSAHNLWDKVDNIDYDKILMYSQRVMTKIDHERLQILNFDIFSIIGVAHKLRDADPIKSKKLFDVVSNMMDWAMTISTDVFKDVFRVNKLLMIKLRGPLDLDQIKYLQNLVLSPKVGPYCKINAYALLDDKKNFIKNYYLQSLDDQKSIMEHPIGRIVEQNGWKIK